MNTCEAVGTALTRLCPPCALRTDLRVTQAQILCSACDKSTRRANHPKPVQPLAQKYSAFVRQSNHLHNSPVSPRDEGRSRSSRTCGEMRWTQELRLDVCGSKRTAKSCGPDVAVLALSPWRGELLAGDAAKSRSPGRAEVSRKAIAQGRPGVPRCTCMLVCASLCAIAHETAGAACTRSSLRPLIREGKTKMQTSGDRAARSRSYIHLSSPAMAGNQYAEPSVIEPRSRSVLDPPPSRGDDVLSIARHCERAEQSTLTRCAMMIARLHHAPSATRSDTYPHAQRCPWDA